MFTGNTIISAIHVLYIDLVADTIPSIALAYEGPAKNIMKEKPNGLDKKIFTKFFIAFLIFSVILERVCQEKCVSYLKFHKNQIVKEQ